MSPLVRQSVAGRAASHRSRSGDSIGSALKFRPVQGERGYAPLPLEQAEAEDEEQAKANAELTGYELDSSRWKPVLTGGEAKRPPVRFVDGSLATVTAGVCLVEGVYRPLLAASLGALELCLDQRRLYRPEGGYKVIAAAAIVSNGIENRILNDLRGQLLKLGIHLLALETQDFTSNYEVLSRRTWDFMKQEMEGMERELLLARPDIPTLADGLLERRLTTIESQRQPVVGMVKRHLRQYLPDPLSSMLYDLRAGERSPAFVIKTANAELVTWYLKLCDGAMGPSTGLVRLAVPRVYLEREFEAGQRFCEISAISRRLCDVRCREESYGRQRVSLEPIVRLEEQLHALLPPVDACAARLRYRLSK